jgi:hypothetical protein
VTVHDVRIRFDQQRRVGNLVHDLDAGQRTDGRGIHRIAAGPTLEHEPGHG